MSDFRTSGGRRGRRILFTCFAALVIFAGALCLFLRVTDIRLDGDPGAYDPQEILAAAGIRKGQSLLLIDRDQAASNVQSAFPALSNASVSCSLPGLVTVRVNESRIRALISYEGEQWVFDEYCHVIGKAENGTRYVTVSGLEVSGVHVGREMTADRANAGALACTKTILTQLVARGLADGVSSLNVENLANIEFVYDGTFTVKLGTGSKLEYKLERFASVIQSVLEEGKTGGTIDVSNDGKSYYSP
ncbi:MAG: FtsQ-type POTRA domain-containing protein [Oscillospiraceae bacterium]|nr:FtsQ-type POTRA domain-containing protein [Oscillospiraceae bacterium]